MARKSSHPRIEALIADRGGITIGAIDPIPCAATAADEHGTLAMLARRKGETVQDLLDRLEQALDHYWTNEESIDEVNG